MNEMILHMYVVAVDSGRLTIEFVPRLYRSEVAEILKIELT